MDPVYDPQEDSQLIKCFIPLLLEDTPGALVLDMGTGSGILAEHATYSAGKIIAVDINPAAIDAVRDLVAEKQLKQIDARVSDFFSNVPEQFNLIICNPPYLPADPYLPDPALDGGREGHEFIVRFLHEAKQHLLPKGKILLLFSSLSNKEKILAACDQMQYAYTELAAEPYFMETLYVYVLWRA
ncbi:MAG: HemK2/MTQ2 family protein methyltransferase [archaeon]